MKGLTDAQQAVFVFISAIFIAVGAVTVPSGISDANWIGFILMIIGAIGLGIKEALGTITKPSTPPT
jgi:hypothetical protein